MFKILSLAIIFYAVYKFAFPKQLKSPEWLDDDDDDEFIDYEEVD